MTGQAIASHPLVRKLGFTGSTEVGQVIMRSCADSNLKKVSLELGGKSPLVIFSDCDLDKAVRLVMLLTKKKLSEVIKNDFRVCKVFFSIKGRIV